VRSSEFIRITRFIRGRFRKVLQLFSELRPAVPGEDGEGKIWQGRGMFAKGEIMKITPRTRDSDLRLGFPFANGLLSGLRSN
jgi:hypothetical protein